MAGNWTAPESAVRRRAHLQREAGAAGDAKLVLTITDEAGKQVRRMDIDKRRACGASRGTCAAIPRRPARIRRSGRGGGGGFGGRGGPPQGPLVAPGRYRATLGKLIGDTVTPIGPPQSFTVVQIAQ